MKFHGKIILLVVLSFLLSISINGNELEPKESDLLLLMEQVDDNYLYIEYFDNNQKKSEVRYKGGTPDGEQIAWDKNGKIINKSVFKNGTGTERIFNEDKLSAEIKYLNGSMIKMTEYDLNGKKLKEENYKNNLLDGDYIIWDKNGKIMYKTKLKNGTGNVKIIFEESGEYYIEEYSVKDGMNDGEYKTTYKDKIISQENYKVGVLDGIQSYYSEKGEKLSEKIYKNGMLDGKYTIWNKDGKLMYETIFKDGTGLDKTYDEEGNLRIESQMKNGKYDGETKMYDNNGITALITYKENTFNGPTIYYRNGVKKTEYNYKNGILDGKYAVWDKNGKKIYETNFVNGEGVLREYDNDGKVYFEAKYLTGGVLSELKTDTNIMRYNNGVSNGKQEFYFYNGKKSYEINYKDSIVTGEFKAWNINGDLFYETNIVNGNGITKYYLEPSTFIVDKYENGAIKESRTYTDKRFQLDIPESMGN